MSETYAYIRVSTKEQNEARQLDAIKDLEIKKDHIYMDKESGKNFERKNYQRLRKKLKEGDTLFVKSIDRLGRNYTEIIEEWRQITKITKANIVVLDMPLLDTRSTGKDLTGSFIADLVLQVLSYVAEAEYRNIHQRQMEGIQAAKARGVKFGRHRKPVPEAFYENEKLWEQGKITMTEAAKRAGMSFSTFSRRAQDQTV